MKRRKRKREKEKSWNRQMKVTELPFLRLGIGIFKKSAEKVAEQNRILSHTVVAV